MSVVKINAITVPKERADELVTRFAARAGEVSKMPGFEAFELLDGGEHFRGIAAGGNLPFGQGHPRQVRAADSEIDQKA